MKFRELIEAKRKWELDTGINTIVFRKSKPNASNEVNFELTRRGDVFDLERIQCSSKTGKHSERILKYGISAESMIDSLEYLKLPMLTLDELNSIPKK
jgi:hypothetical protein